LLRNSDALHLDIFQQPPDMGFSDRFLEIFILFFYDCIYILCIHSVQ
jgi:hypothetical protein